MMADVFSQVLIFGLGHLKSNSVNPAEGKRCFPKVSAGKGESELCSQDTRGFLGHRKFSKEKSKNMFFSGSLFKYCTKDVSSVIFKLLFFYFHCSADDR